MKNKYIYLDHIHIHFTYSCTVYIVKKKYSYKNTVFECRFNFKFMHKKHRCTYDFLLEFMLCS